jgi:hypothetical protein
VCVVDDVPRPKRSFLEGRTISKLAVSDPTDNRAGGGSVYATPLCPEPEDEMEEEQEDLSYGSTRKPFLEMDRKTSEEMDRKPSQEMDRKTSQEMDRKPSQDAGKTLQDAKKTSEEIARKTSGQWIDNEIISSIVDRKTILLWERR